jgi:Na+/H+ antiporter NhaD/arsenite permease-like protein
MSSIFLLYLRLKREPLLLILIIVFPLLWDRSSLPFLELTDLIDFQTLGALAGLMTLSRALEESGALTTLARSLIKRFQSERTLSFFFILFSAGLSCLITNDISLFIIVPITLGIGKWSNLNTGKLIIFEAMAVNAGSALSPIGNPQNIFLWQSAGVSAPRFILEMLPISFGMMSILILIAAFSFSPKKLSFLSENETASPPVKRKLFWVSLFLYAPFIFFTDMGFAVPMTAAVFIFYLFFFREVLKGFDVFLIIIFFMMFLNMELMTRDPSIALLTSSALDVSGGVFTASALLSQMISNVPAAIFLNGFVSNWTYLAWGVNVGGFGLAIGSLANIIALRLANQPGLWREFHLYSIPMFFLSWLLGCLWVHFLFPIAL